MGNESEFICQATCRVFGEKFREGAVYDIYLIDDKYYIIDDSQTLVEVSRSSRSYDEWFVFGMTGARFAG